MFLRIRTRSPSSFLFHKLSKSHSLALTRSLPSIPSVPFVKPAISRHQISLWPSITSPAHQNLLLKIRKIRNVRSQSLCFLKPYWVSSMFWGSVLGTNFIMAPKEKWSMLFFPRPTRALVSLFYTLLHPPASTPPSLPLLILDEQLGRPYLSYFSLTSSVPPSSLADLIQLHNISLTFIPLLLSYRRSVPSLPSMSTAAWEPLYPPCLLHTAFSAPSRWASNPPTAPSQDILIAT